MILDFIFTAINGLLSFVFSLLPVASLTGVLLNVTSAVHDVGARLAPWNAYLPLSELLAVLVILVGVWMPALLIYVGANWVWRHIPDIAGFGPGAG